MKRLLLLVAIGSFCCSSCSIAPRSWTREKDFEIEDLRSESPIVKVKAIHQLVEQKESGAVPELIRLLDDEESTVRNNAYWGLVQLTGHERPHEGAPEYNYLDSRAERAPAVEAWRKFGEEQAGK